MLSLLMVLTTVFLGFGIGAGAFLVFDHWISKATGTRSFISRLRGVRGVPLAPWIDHFGRLLHAVR